MTHPDGAYAVISTGACVASETIPACLMQEDLRLGLSLRFTCPIRSLGAWPLLPDRGGRTRPKATLSSDNKAAPVGRIPSRPLRCSGWVGHELRAGNASVSRSGFRCQRRSDIIGAVEHAVRFGGILGDHNRASVGRLGRRATGHRRRGAIHTQGACRRLPTNCVCTYSRRALRSWGVGQCGHAVRLRDTRNRHRASASHPCHGHAHPTGPLHRRADGR